MNNKKSARCPASKFSQGGQPHAYVSYVGAAPSKSLPHASHAAPHPHLNTSKVLPCCGGHQITYTATIRKPKSPHSRKLKVVLTQCRTDTTRIRSDLHEVLLVVWTACTPALSASFSRLYHDVNKVLVKAVLVEEKKLRGRGLFWIKTDTLLI
jgi:hypothetical protein